MAATSHPPSPRDPLPRRLWAYLLERFPPGAYVLLVGLFYASAVLVARRLAGAPRALPWQGAPVVLLVFFHLRVIDEHKDRETDLRAYPERLLSRGVVTLPLLARCAAVAVAIEAGLSAWLGTRALLSWAVALVFTGLMRVEFGLGGWLRRHILAYALAHNPIVALLALYGWAAAGVPFRPGFLLYAAMVSAGSLAFEIGRKTRLPAEEIAGVPSYSSELGRRAAGHLLAGLVLLTAALGVALVLVLDSRLAASLGLLAASALAGAWPALAGARLPRVEGGASIALLGSLLAAGVAAW